MDKEKKKAVAIVSKAINHKGKALTTREIAAASPAPMPELTKSEHAKASGKKDSKGTK